MPGNTAPWSRAGRPPARGDQSESGKVRASSMTRSLASVSPMEIRAPSPANGRTTIPSSSAAAANSAVRSPAANQTKLPCASGNGEPDVGQALDHALPLGDEALDPLEQLRLGAQRGDGGRLGDVRDAERQADRAQGGGDRRRGDGVPDPEAGQAVGLGEGARGDDVVVGAHGRDAVDRVAHPHELDVRLVDDDQHVLGHPRQEARRARSASPTGRSGCWACRP